MDSNKKSELYAKFSKRYAVSEDEVDKPGLGYKEPVKNPRKICVIPPMRPAASVKSAKRREEEWRRNQLEQVASMLKARGLGLGAER